jgi:hypothetical protein
MDIASHTRSKILRVTAEALIAGFCGFAFIFVLLGFFISNTQNSVLGQRDFVIYWSTATQLVHHANPYDPEVIPRLEHTAGFAAWIPAMYVRNPPFFLPLIYPLGLLPMKLASMLWSTVLVLSLIASVYLLRILHGRPNNVRHWLGLSFAPALICADMGQTALFVLLGLALFLYLHRSYPFFAGMALWLCMLKPHLLLPLGVVLLVWIVVERMYKVLAGAALALALSLYLTYLMDPLAWSQYAQMARESGVQGSYIPCASAVFRICISKSAAWLQFLPVILASIWAVIYYWRRRMTWNWAQENGGLLTIVSFLTAPYSWLYDAGVVLPGLLAGAYRTRSRNSLIALAMLSAIIELEILCNLKRQEALFYWTIWTAPAWLIWYLIATVPAARWAEIWSNIKTRKWLLSRSEADETC